MLATTVSIAQNQEHDFDALTAGALISPQSDDFAPWGGSEVDAFVSSTFSSSPSNSLQITGDGANDNDVLWLLGDQLGGQFTMSYKAYIPDGKTSFFGLLQTEDPSNAIFSTNIYTNLNGTGDDVVTQDGTIINTGNWFFFEEWNEVTIYIDLDIDAIEMIVNGETIYEGEMFLQGSFALGSVDLWCPGADCDVYYDDMVFVEGILSTTDVAANEFVSAMSNGTLTLKAQENINSVAIYNMLGQQVYNANVNALQSTVDMSNLSNGTYIVKVNINGTEGSVKVIR
tara:strand:+ start:65 stop:919 length:855 start_codon:yes stop_codon:yes gene_type:complete